MTTPVPEMTFSEQLVLCLLGFLDEKNYKYHGPFQNHLGWYWQLESKGQYPLRDIIIHNTHSFYTFHLAAGSMLGAHVGHQWHDLESHPSHKYDGFDTNTALSNEFALLQSDIVDDLLQNGVAPIPSVIDPRVLDFVPSAYHNRIVR